MLRVYCILLIVFVFKSLICFLHNSIIWTFWISFFWIRFRHQFSSWVDKLTPPLLNKLCSIRFLPISLVARCKLFLKIAGSKMMARSMIHLGNTCQGKWARFLCKRHNELQKRWKYVVDKQSD